MNLFGCMDSKSTQNGTWESTKDTLKIPRHGTNFRTATLEAFTGARCSPRRAELASTAMRKLGVQPRHLFRCFQSSASVSLAISPAASGTHARPCTLKVAQSLRFELDASQRLALP